MAEADIPRVIADSFGVLGHTAEVSTFNCLAAPGTAGGACPVPARTGGTARSWWAPGLRDFGLTIAFVIGSPAPLRLVLG